MSRILLVEDEPDIVLGLMEDLGRQGHDATLARDGEEGLRLGRAGGWDVILLDVMLPGMNGFDVCTELRQAGVTTPVIMLTARTEVADKVFGLESGADDYVTKPFNVRELRARIRSQLRRSQLATTRRAAFGECEVDFDRAELRRAGRPVDVTPLELRLLEVLIKNPGRVLSRDRLIGAAWGHGVSVSDRTVDTHVFNLRRKIEAVPSEPRFLVGVRGLGYRFENADLTEI